MSKILTIEDDASIQMGIKNFLESESFEVITASDGISGFEMAISSQPDIILLDIMLPGKNGYDVCRDIRAQGLKVPIIMLTSKNEEIDKILGLEIGADDYVTKPFGIRELLARVRAQLRRTELSMTSTTGSEFNFGDVKIIWKNREVLKSGQKINLSAKEYQVLKYLIEHESQVVTREMLLDEVWGYESFPTTRTVDNYILSIRKKVENDQANPMHIITIHTLGYKFIK